MSHFSFAPTFDTKRDDLDPQSFAPGQVQKGEPRYRTKLFFESADRALCCGLWDCTAGSFLWDHGADEIVQILEGEVIVEGVRLIPGNIAYYAAGSRTYWEVPKYVKKSFVLRGVRKSTLRRVASLVKRRLFE